MVAAEAKGSRVQGASASRKAQLLWAPEQDLEPARAWEMPSPVRAPVIPAGNRWATGLVVGASPGWMVAWRRVSRGR